MNTKRTQPVLYALIVAVIAGCASTPETRFYTLDMRPSGTSSTDMNIEIRRIQNAESLASNNILIKATPTEIEYYAVDEWVSGVDELVAEKLAAELGENTSADNQYLLSGNILAFEQVDKANGAEAHLKIQIAIEDNHADKNILTRTYDIVESVSTPEAGTIVSALSKCVEKLAQDITHDLKLELSNNK